MVKAEFSGESLLSQQLSRRRFVQLSVLSLAVPSVLSACAGNESEKQAGYPLQKSYMQVNTGEQVLQIPQLTDDKYRDETGMTIQFGLSLGNLNKSGEPWTQLPEGAIFLNFSISSQDTANNTFVRVDCNSKTPIIYNIQKNGQLPVLERTEIGKTYTIAVVSRDYPEEPNKSVEARIYQVTKTSEKDIEGKYIGVETLPQTSVTPIIPSNN